MVNVVFNEVSIESNATYLAKEILDHQLKEQNFELTPMMIHHASNKHFYF